MTATQQPAVKQRFRSRFRVWAWTCAVLIAVAGGAGELRLRELRGDMARQRAAAERALAARNALAREHAALQVGAAGATRGAAVTAERIAELRRARDAAALRVRNLSLAAGAPADPVWPNGEVVTRADEWSDRGAGTPENAMETLLWSARAGRVDRLAEVIGFSNEVRTLVEDWFSRLPTFAQGEMGTPEHAVATLIAGRAAFDYSAAGWQPVNPAPNQDVRMQVRIETQGQQQQDLEFALSRTDQGWKVLVPAAAFIELRKQLTK